MKVIWFNTSGFFNEKLPLIEIFINLTTQFFFSILSKHVEHNRWPFLLQNVFVDLSISFLHIKHLKIGDIQIIINKKVNSNMSPIFKCLVCQRDIERSTKTFWIKKGHLLCSTCLDNIDKNFLNNNKMSKKPKY